MGETSGDKTRGTAVEIGLGACATYRVCLALIADPGVIVLWTPPPIAVAAGLDVTEARHWRPCAGTASIARAAQWDRMLGDVSRDHLDRKAPRLRGVEPEGTSAADRKGRTRIHRR